MFLNSIKVFHRFLIGGLLVILCIVFMDSFVGHQSGLKTKKIVSKSIFHNKLSEIENVAAQKLISSETEESRGDSEISEASAIVLWWTPFIDELEYTKNCGNSVCYFTGNQKYFNHEKLKVITCIPQMTYYKFHHNKSSYIFCRLYYFMEVI